VWLIALSTPLDGLLDFTVTLPRNGLHEVALLAADRTTVLQTGLWASATTKRISTTICGERSFVLRVTQKGALGRVTVIAATP
jgi:type IV secretory pathway TrbD component